MPMPNATSSTSHKRPFQDITDRFVASPRPKRKPKIPGGALGDKLRLRVIETTNGKSFPSSLPPSSPPLLYSSSSSRGLPLLNSEDQVELQVHHDEAFFGRDDFNSMLPSEEEGDVNEDDDEDAENRPPTPLSDPFGFFAVERKLKAERKVIPVAAHGHRFTDDKGRDDGLVMPATPHKPTLGKRRLSATATAEPDALSPAVTSLASSPSPVKGVGLRRSYGESEMNTSRGVLPIRDGEDDDDDAPPKGEESTRAGGKKKDAVAAKPKKRGRTATKAKPAPKVQGKKKVVVEDDDSEDDRQEKFEAERQARLEYFRKLDDYSFEKENVYVV
ncbi:hypothetical protein C8R46DRAFT_1212155 [Mycena filopes]|nr:hypothetical protein C8R46DRAFT_1212155 [Mycena filopes]